MAEKSRTAMWFERAFALAGVVALAAVPSLIQMSPQTFDANLAGWQQRVLSIVSNAYFIAALALVSGVAIAVWFLRSGDPVRVGHFAKKVWHNLNKPLPSDSAPQRTMSDADREAWNAARFGSALAPLPPLPPLPEHEVTLRLKLLDEMRAVFLPRAQNAYDNVMQKFGAQREAHLLYMEDGREKLLTALTELTDTYQQIKRDVVAIQKRHPLDYPDVVVNNFPGADAFFQASGRMSEGLQHLQMPITTPQARLLEPWVDRYTSAMAPFMDWANECIKQLALMREATLKRMRPGFVDVTPTNGAQVMLSFAYENREPWRIVLPTTNFVADGEHRNPPALWICVELLAANGTAKNCAVVLAKVERLFSAGYTETEYNGALRLRWGGGRPERWGTANVSQVHRGWVDVISVDDYFNAVSVKLNTDLIAHKDIFKPLGVYRLTIGASADNAPDTFASFVLIWAGNRHKTEFYNEADMSEAKARERFAELVKQ